MGHLLLKNHCREKSCQLLNFSSLLWPWPPHKHFLYVLKTSIPDVMSCMEGTDAWFSNIVLNITPWPAHIATGETITLDGAIDILQEVEMGSGLDLKLTLVTAIGNLPIPCLPIGELNF